MWKSWKNKTEVYYFYSGFYLALAMGGGGGRLFMGPDEGQNVSIFRGGI